MSPLEYMQRLSALVLRLRLHLIRFHGVLAPKAKLRALVARQEAEALAQTAIPAECEVGCARHRLVRLSGLVQPIKWVTPNRPSWSARSLPPV